uniref:Uncharacterized protein n=1 Tax=Acrobeloides nanus TaxID=290746 RepID=A0A914E8M0_9BILA
MAFTTMNNLNYFAKTFIISVRFAATATQQSSYSPLFSFYHKDLKIVQIDQSRMKPKPTSWDNLKFGHSYSDHMMEVDWDMHNGTCFNGLVSTDLFQWTFVNHATGEKSL